MPVLELFINHQAFAFGFGLSVRIAATRLGEIYLMPYNPSKFRQGNLLTSNSHSHRFMTT